MPTPTKRLGKTWPASLRARLRHFAVAPNGRLAAALQFEGDRRQPGTPLMVFCAGEDALQMADALQPAWDRMQHYAASVAYDPGSRRFALTYPYGGVIACWETSGSFAGLVDVPKVSGLAFDMHAGFASNELGEIYRLDLSAMRANLYAKFPGMQRDNHLYLA